MATAQNEATTRASEATTEASPEATTEASPEAESTTAANDQNLQGSEGCASPQPIETFSGSENQRTAPFDITGESFRILFETEPAGQDPSLPTVEVDVLNENGRPIGEGFLAFEGEDGAENIIVGPGTFSLEIRADEASYDITVEDCTADPAGGEPEPEPEAEPKEVPAPEDVIRRTAPEEPLPDTGGLPLLALAVLGLVSAAAGLSVIRGGRR